jgi:hypothetical protein
MGLDIITDIESMAITIIGNNSIDNNLFFNKFPLNDKYKNI